MADQKDQAKEKKKLEEADQDHEQSANKSGGNMGAGRSGQEDLGSEKPSESEGLGSHKPAGSSSH